MKIHEKSLSEYSSQELKNRRNEIIAKLNDAGVNPDLSKGYRKDRERKTKNYQSELQELSSINTMLGINGGYTDVYNGFIINSSGSLD